MREGLNMFIRKEVKKIAKDLVENYQDWYWDKFAIYNYKDINKTIWIANGCFFVDFHPEPPCIAGFNLIEKFKLYRAIRKCMRLNDNSHHRPPYVRYLLKEKN